MARSSAEEDLKYLTEEDYEEEKDFLDPSLPCGVSTDMDGSTAETQNGFQTHFQKEVDTNQLESTTIQQDDMMSTTSSSSNSTILTTRCPSSLTTEEQVDPEIAPSVITQSHEISSERLQLLPPMQALHPEISNSKPESITTLIGWKQQDDVPVGPPEQTVTQLLHSHTERFRMRGTPEAMALDLPHSTSPAMELQSDQIEHVGTNNLADASATNLLHVNMENHQPFFECENVEADRPFVYCYMVVSENQHICIRHSTPISQGRDNNQEVIYQMKNPWVKDSGEIQTSQCTEADNTSASATIPAINRVNIPPFQIQSLKMKVVVSHVVDPSNFYIQHADSHEELQTFIKIWKAGSSYAEQNCIPDLGTCVMAWVPKQEQWCRAEVMKICGMSTDKNSKDGTRSRKFINVEVFMLDYGDTATLSLWNVKEMTPEVAALPLQALQVSLAKVWAMDGYQWCENTVKFFKSVTQNRIFCAQLHPRWPNFTVDLFYYLPRSELPSENNNQPSYSNQNAGVQTLESEWDKYLFSPFSQD